ncbi:hypothetical protein [Nostocoides veronense]|uniref:hypothetical protein n=1 Tax=Nostocoides veronense TaxID=330836 RepID=UPI0031D1DECA
MVASRPQGRRSFLQRLGALGPHWTAAGVNFYATPKVAWGEGVVATDLNGVPV